MILRRVPPLRPPLRPSRLTFGVAVALAGLLLASGCGAGGGQAADGGSPAAPTAAGPAAAATGAAASPASPAGPATQSAVGVSSQLAFDAATTDGGTLTGASLAGRPVMFWFWAPWCTICRGEAPEIARMHGRFGGQVQFVGVAGLGQVAAMRAFVADTGLGAFPHLVDDDGGLWSRFGVEAQPAFAFVTAGGQVETEPRRLTETELADRLGTLTGA